MAVKKRATRTQKPKQKEVVDTIENYQMPTVENTEVKKNKMGWLGWAGILLALLCVYWWKTNNWPVVAVVGNKPIFRSTVNKELYKQGGKSVIDSLVTEKLVENELAKNNVKVSDQEIDTKLAEIKKSFPTEAEFDAALTQRNLGMTELKRQIGLQMGIEKLLSDRVEVTASDTAAFIKQMGSVLTASTEAEKQVEAEKILKEQKIQQEINTWIEEIRTKGKVWWIGKV